MGFVFGLVAPLLGVLLGFDVMPWLSNLLLMPITMVSNLFDAPFGELPLALRLGLWFASALCWALLFGGVERWVEEGADD